MLRSRQTSKAHSYGALLSALVLLLYPAWKLRADEIYKSVDADGHVIYSDHKDGSPGQQTVVLGDAQSPPEVIHFCWTNCFTLTLDHGRYTRADGADETWTIQRFTTRSIVLIRHDPPVAWNGFSPDVLYEGHVENDRLINVTIAGKPVSGVDMAWGMSLNTLPANNAERAQAKSAQPMHAASPSPAAIDPVSVDEVHVAEAPPPLPDDEQPTSSAEGYIWTPGSWAWGGADYYWVRGDWVQPPRVGVLWTPGYWAYEGSVYVFHHGYWGPHIGYYGGVNYGFGYAGVGYTGGHWVGNSFSYNRAVNKVNTAVIHNTYNETATAKGPFTKVSYNGGAGGITAAPTPQERMAAAETHLPPTPLQRQNLRQAASNTTPMATASDAHPVVAPGRRLTQSNLPRVVPARSAAVAVHPDASPATGDQPESHRPSAQGQPSSLRATRPATTKPLPHPRQ